jgi:hypothetical protein
MGVHGIDFLSIDRAWTLRHWDWDWRRPRFIVACYAADLQCGPRHGVRRSRLAEFSLVGMIAQHITITTAVVVLTTAMVGTVLAQPKAGTMQWLYEQCKPSDTLRQDNCSAFFLSVAGIMEILGNMYENPPSGVNKSFCYTVWPSRNLFDAFNWR